MGKSKNQVLAFDFGASSGRAIIGYLEDGKIKMEEVYRFSNDPVTVGKTMYWDTLRQFFEIKQGMLKAKQKGGFKSLGIDTWGVDFGLLDEHGVLLENAIHYRDDRTLGMQEEVFKVLPKDRVYNLSGNQFENFNTIFQVYALVKKRPWLLERAETLLLTPDLFNYFLTGEKKAEYTMATTTQLMDAKNRCWSQEILEALEIPEKLLAEIVPSGTTVGELSEDICEELGLEKAKVISVASHDTQSAVVAVPTQKEDFLFISCGTWSLFGTELKEPIINEDSLKYNVSNEGGYGNTTTLLKNIIGLWLVQESRRQWMREGVEYGFGELEQLATKAKPFVSFIDPDAPEFNTAGNIPKRIRQFCARTGQAIPETVGDVVCCINQSLALKYRYTLEQIEACTKKTYPEIHMIGGGIQSKLLCQMTASANNKKVIAGPVEATALGNIAVQLMALGEIENLQKAREIIRASEDTKEYRPENGEDWEEAYQKFKQIIIKEA
ncbi:rhamnulokinase [Ohessyouella blattaphilus]|uniref:Rhamnulokinase n=1 Tax=Ohessyouella blattaphilus TaxID=2949333 RepID=A0ABT1EMK7_9FIRM|nr:rhamnulokinase family protein [Ohessyouella blattaphilus]MCP1110941.1 rhamnulokinase [Ohessyouella blattaphilus]MCR8564335.1 rhamnulokinase [Ohessyouella blattaphilus]